jgi:hypothetical protein
MYQFVGKTGAVTCRTKACHGSEWPTLVLNYDVDRTKVTPVLHMQEVAGPGLVRISVEWEGAVRVAVVKCDRRAPSFF